MDFTAIIVVYVLLVLVLLAALVFTAHLIGKAARMKNRSYLSFFWLSIFVGPWTTGLIVAVLPFNQDDPRHPRNKGMSYNSQQFAPQTQSFDSFN